MFLFVRVIASSRWRIYTRYVRSVRQQASARGREGGKSSDELNARVWSKQKQKKKKLNALRERTKKELLPSAYTAGSCPLSSKAFSSAALIITALFPQEGRLSTAQ